jgi:A/G-specific adenine glycosylase
MKGRSRGKGKRIGRKSAQINDLEQDKETDEVDADREWIKSVQQALTDWNHEYHRDLPWRRERDPYRILVSEMMLVQTTVAAVIPYFDRFLQRFPDPQSLAVADESDVLKVWEGLGYYRRARQLHAAARMIVEQYGGRIPADPQSVRALPGVGRYMAGAILSFAFDRPEPIVEANSQRVLARLVGWKGALETSLSQTRLWKAAERLVPLHGAGKFNQALMDLGALVCTPRSPRCLLCPLNSQCTARRLGLQEKLPNVTPKPPPLAVTEACAVVVCDGRILMVQRGKQGLWPSFWEFPTINLEGADPAGRSFGQTVTLAEGVKRLTGIRVEIGPELNTLTYSVTRYRVVLKAYLALTLSQILKPGPGLAAVKWVEPSALLHLTLGAAPRRLAVWINQHVGRLSWA